MPGGTSVPPALDRSMSQRAAPTQVAPKALDRSMSHRHPDPRTPAPLAPPPSQKPGMQSSHPSRAPGGQSGSAATAALSRQASKAAPGSSGTATPRRREKPKENFDVVARLKAICTDADPTKLYRSLVKIGQG